MNEVDLDDLREELLQCRRCGICREAVYDLKGFEGICPIWRNTSGFEPSFMRGKIQIAIALLDGVLERTSENAEALYQCTLCGNCTQICGAEFHPAHVIETVRGILEEIPNEARDRLAASISTNDNPYQEEASVKREWVKEMEFDIPTEGDTLYFTGCTASLRMQETAKNTARILHAVGEDFFVMENEPCCGSVLLRTGKQEVARTNAERAAKAIKESGAKKIIVSCAGCMKTLKKDFAELFDLDLPEIVHIVQYAAQLIEEQKIPLKNIETKKVTYHDPCHIGRELGIYDEPRKVIDGIPGLELVEMNPNRSAAICCGAGGGLRSYDPDLSKRIAADRVKVAEGTGAEIIITACPFCETNLNSGADLINSSVRTVDIVDLLAGSIKAQE